MLHSGCYNTYNLNKDKLHNYVIKNFKLLLRQKNSRTIINDNNIMCKYEKKENIFKVFNSKIIFYEPFVDISTFTLCPVYPRNFYFKFHLDWFISLIFVKKINICIYKALKLILSSNFLTFLLIVAEVVAFAESLFGYYILIIFICKKIIIPLFKVICSGIAIFLTFKYFVLFIIHIR
ncbi:conserved Plasmodium protein, unknown function [Plasmodium gallinaceum]|uniref:Uncharacterized protein n=1 Tax=Plasmodium gallinaceum TaxID=5849 RepID=A0A1J1GYB8_PLAGA|nr:conserved Plasmodium protein, unknown function [Plasmodium gallinaceum]CRG97303.1 conserved Plasmodium protein, unknown function [Plasmodium gallinaceum]